MKLKQVVIQGFRSVPGTLTFHVRPTLTCLIGANEHGKSNILEAIQRLNTLTFDSFDQYSHSTSETDPTITYVFELSEADKKRFLDQQQSTRELVEAQADNAAASPDKTPEEIKKINDRLRWHTNTLKHYEKEKNNQISIEVNGAGKNKLDLVRMFYNLPEKPLWKTYLGTRPPEVRLFSASQELSDTITLEELQDQRNLPFEGLLKLVPASTSARSAIMSPRNNFRSFLAFALTLYAETESLDPEGFILLFDEPGIHLHPQGQKDLLREIRRLSTRNQIIYTTHSPFMIDRNDLDATILVKKETVGRGKGTTLVYRPYSANWESLNAALGVGPSDAFFPPERSLLVEGSSDRAYLAKYMGLTASTTKADLNFLNIIDADRREEMEAVARILISAGREIVVLADGDEGGKNWEKWLRRISGAKRTQLQFIDMRAISKSNKPVAVEDLLPSEPWLQAVETWLREVRGVNHTIDRPRVAQLADTQTIGRAVGDYLVEQEVLQWPKQFSKTNVADFFCRGEVPIPMRDDPILRLCVEITRRLSLVRQ